MKYYLCEEPGEDKSALTKARRDVSEILSALGWNELCIHRKIEEQNKYIHYLRMGWWTAADWSRITGRLRRGDTLLIQFPMLNSLFFNKIAARFILYAKKRKNIKVILLIHDIDSIRFPDDRIKQESHEAVFWDLSDVIIAHNESMKKYLQERRVNKKIVCLGIFDYLTQNTEKEISENTGNEVVIAGNLDGNKTAYLMRLREIKDVKFNLYGPGYTDRMGGENISYRGVYPPEELPEKIEGSWGLVWDGSETDTCAGGYGNYLRYNNPHKISFYISIGMPVIIWKEAALAKFVTDNGIGLVIDSLEEIAEKQKSVKPEEYRMIRKQVQDLSQKVKSGYFLKTALEKSVSNE